MRKLLTTFVCVWFTLAVWAGDGIYEKLQQIPQISEIQKLDVKPFQEYYQFWFEQPVDHSDPAPFFRSKCAGRRDSLGKPDHQAGCR